MKKIKELNNKQKITVIIVITVFIVSLFLLINNISQVGKLKADITNLTIRDNKIILNVNSTKQKIMNKTQEANINIYSNNQEIGNDTKIKLIENFDKLPEEIKKTLNKLIEEISMQKCVD